MVGLGRCGGERSHDGIELLKGRVEGPRAQRRGIPVLALGAEGSVRD